MELEESTIHQLVLEYTAKGLGIIQTQIQVAADRKALPSIEVRGVCVETTLTITNSRH